MRNERDFRHVGYGWETLSMSRAAEAMCEAAFAAKSQVVPLPRRWSGPHAVNIRLTIHLLTQSYYLTILAGPERRSNERLRRQREKHPLVSPLHGDSAGPQTKIR